VAGSDTRQISTLGTTKIRSNLHAGQYVGGVPSDHSQGQALVEPPALLGVTRLINKFLCEAAQEGAGGLVIQWRTQNILMGVLSVACGGHLYLVCAVCDVTI